MTLQITSFSHRAVPLLKALFVVSVFLESSLPESTHAVASLLKRVYPTNTIEHPLYIKLCFNTRPHDDCSDQKSTQDASWTLSEPWGDLVLTPLFQ